MDNSYWIESCKQDRKEYPKLKEHLEADIAIIGGGLTGLSIAYYLTKKGIENVVVIEKNRICSSTSGNTTAKITSQHGIFYNYLLNSVGKKGTKEYLQANEKAIKNIAEIIEEEEIECDFEWQDSYVFAQSKEGLEKIKKEQEALEYLGFEKSTIEEKIELPIKDKEQQDKEHLHINKEILGALKFTKQAQFNPIFYAIGLAEKIEKRKGKIYENSKVINIKRENEKYEIQTEEGRINSKVLVIATHYPIVNFPGFYFLKMYQETSYIIGVETKGELFNRNVYKCRRYYNIAKNSKK